MIGPPWRSRVVRYPRLMPSGAYFVHVVSGDRDTAPSVPFNYTPPVTAPTAVSCLPRFSTRFGPEGSGLFQKVHSFGLVAEGR